MSRVGTGAPMWKTRRWGHISFPTWKLFEYLFYMDFIHFSNMLLKASTAEQAFVACVSAGWAKLSVVGRF